MPLINWKVHLELNWIENCILSRDGGTAKFKVTDVKLHVPIVTLSTKDNVNLKKQFSDGFKRCIYWKSYQTNPAKVIEKGENLCELLSASFQVTGRLFALAYFVPGGATNNGGIKSNESIFFQEEILKIITY